MATQRSSKRQLQAAGETPSAVSDSLTLLDGPAAFEKHLQLILGEGGRQVHILSKNLDPALFSTESTCDLISRIARSHRQAEIFILVREAQDLVGIHHRLVALHQRLSSKIHLRRSLLEADPENKAYVIVDGRQLLFQHNDGDYEGFCNTDAGPESKALLEEFRGLWDRQSDEIKDLRPLML